MEDRFHQKKYPHNIKMPALYYIHLQFALPALSLVLVVPDSDNHSAYSLDSVDYPILLRTSSSHKKYSLFSGRLSTLFLQMRNFSSKRANPS